MLKNILLALMLGLSLTASAMSPTGDGEIVGGDGGSGSITGDGGGWDSGD